MRACRRDTMASSSRTERAGARPTAAASPANVTVRPLSTPDTAVRIARARRGAPCSRADHLHYIVREPYGVVARIVVLATGHRAEVVGGRDGECGGAAAQRFGVAGPRRRAQGR